ncbi:Ig-like domain repeat protein [Paenibacillus sp. OK003]|uniref:Ig-like domain repeat protein n=1 Tax=Paenibacillus sp. OK003 TaxID=1884380 RepID=UPI0020C8909C|nr:Ig-like domain repeat protein [Paenibacillus sp. OK003]
MIRKAKQKIIILVILALTVPALMDKGIGTVQAQSATISEISASSPSSTYRKEVTFTATVSNTAIEQTTPSGTVTFMDGDQALGAAPLRQPEPKITTSSTSATIPAENKNACKDGPNSFTSSPCPIVQWGQYTYWAYSYNNNDDAMNIVAYDASGNIVKQWTKRGARYLWKITMDAAAQTLTFWGQDNLTITMGLEELLPPASLASFTTADLEIGTHAIHAEYSGDANYSPSQTSQLSYEVNRIPSVTELSSSENPSRIGKSVDLIASVTSSDLQEPLTGTVDFINGSNLLIGSAPIVNGIAKLSVSSLSVGLNYIEAKYNGDDHYAGSHNFLHQAVDLKRSSVLLTSSKSETLHGDSVVLTAKIDSPDGGTPTGNVVFWDGKQQMAEISLSDGEGVFTTSDLGIGKHSLTATYEGDDIFHDSISGEISLEVSANTLAMLNSTIGTVSKGGTSQETIKNIPYGTTLAALKAAIIPTAFATFEVYDADGIHVAQTLVTGKKVIVTAEDGVTKVTYTVTLLAPVQTPSDTPATGGGSSTPNNDSPTPTNTPVTSNNGQLTLPAGRAGEVRLGTGISISIPVNATSKDMQLIIKQVQDTLNLLKNNEILASPVYELEKNFMENFNVPITLTFVFDPSIIKDKQKAVVFYYDEVKKVWVEVGGKVIGNQITVDVDHFTKFAVLAAEQTATLNVIDITGHWAEVNIQKAIALGIINGYTDGTFKPNTTVTRAEFAVMLMNALKPQFQSEGAALTFTDEPQIAAWAREAVAQAVTAGIITGYQDGAFHPNDPITRAEMAVMLAKSSGKLIEGSATTRFADDKAIVAWARGSILSVQQSGLMQGKGNNHFAPQDNTTRAEAVTVLINSLSQKEN